MGNKFVLYTWTNYIYEDEIKLKQTLKVLPKLKKKKDSESCNIFCWSGDRDEGCLCYKALSIHCRVVF